MEYFQPLSRAVDIFLALYDVMTSPALLKKKTPNRNKSKLSPVANILKSPALNQ